MHGWSVDRQRPLVMATKLAEDTSTARTGPAPCIRAQTTSERGLWKKLLAIRSLERRVNVLRCLTRSGVW